MFGITQPSFKLLRSCTWPQYSTRTALYERTYIVTSGFWPRVRARALRAPVFLGALPRPTGRCAPHHSSQLRCSLENKNNYFQK
jgi:hypothetical protein